MGLAIGIRLRGALLVGVLATTVAAQQETAPDAVPAPALTIAKLYVRSAELPDGCRFAVGMPRASDHMDACFHATSLKSLVPGMGEVPPEAEAMFPVPKAKEWQAFQAEGGVAGSVFMFEYSEADLEKARAFFPSFLHGADGVSKEHPEEIIIQDRLVIVLSFPRGDPAAEWYKHRLRSKFKVPALRERLELRDLGVRLVKALRGGDLKAGLALFEKNSAKVKDWAFGQFLLGTFSSASGDWQRAEKAYKRALELHDTLEDPLQEGLVWPTLDAIGLALLHLDKPESAVPILKRAEELGTKRAVEGVATSSYNLACACALLKRWAEARDALERAIRGDPKHKKMASTDEDFAEARKRKEFQALLR